MSKLMDAIYNRKRYKGLSWYENFLGGHFDIGKMITIYGENVMHWGVSIKTARWGYICFRLPFRCFGCWWPLYFYVSPNATPWASTFYLGPNKFEKTLSRRRRNRYGHNFNDDLMGVDNG